MGYQRVIPRDLFNEGNLLKCYGRLWINLDNMAGHDAELLEPDGLSDGFKVRMDPSDGSISIGNVLLRIGRRIALLKRPMNSRDAWPLYLVGWADDDDDDFEEIAVFNDDGSFSDDMIELLTKEGKGVLGEDYPK